MFCIKCGAKLFEISERCPTCGADLVGTGASPALSWFSSEMEELGVEDFYEEAGCEWRMASVWVARNTAEAAAARGLLEAAGIPVRVKAPTSSMPDVGVVVGGMEILVPEAVIDYARELLKSAEPSAKDEDLENDRIANGELGMAVKALGALALLVGAVTVSFGIIKNHIMGRAEA